MKVNPIPFVVFCGAGIWLIDKGWEVYVVNPAASVLAVLNGFFAVTIGCYLLKIRNSDSTKKVCELPTKSYAAEIKPSKNPLDGRGSSQLSEGMGSEAVDLSNDEGQDIEESRDDEGKTIDGGDDDKEAPRVIEIPEHYHYPDDPFSVWHDEPLAWLEGDYIYFSSTGICAGIDIDRLCIKKDRAQFYCERWGEKNEIFREVTKSSWEDITKRISQFPLKKWHGNEYCNHEILDGEKWVLSIRLDGGKIKCEVSGRNDYPPNEGSSDSKECGRCFSDLRQLLSEFMDS